MRIQRPARSWSLPGSRAPKLSGIFGFLLLALAVKVLFDIVYEYQWYFPADFVKADFLVGRELFFSGVYRAAFYVHLISGPVALLLAWLLMFTGKSRSPGRLHRRAGKALIVIVATMIVPTGLVMATRAFTGAIAGWGFALLSIATLVCAIVCCHHAMNKRFLKHQQWATRCTILLMSPLVLRVFNGLMIVTQLESSYTYQMSAWLSWTLPLIGYELRRLRLSSRPQQPLSFPIHYSDSQEVPG